MWYYQRDLWPSASSGTHVEGNHGETHCSTSVIGTLHHEFGRGKAGQRGVFLLFWKWAMQRKIQTQVLLCEDLCGWKVMRCHVRWCDVMSYIYIKFGMLYTPFHSLKELQYRFLPIHISLSVWDWGCGQEFNVPNQNLFLLNGWEFEMVPATKWLKQWTLLKKWGSATWVEGVDEKILKSGESDLKYHEIRVPIYSNPQHNAGFQDVLFVTLSWTRTTWPTCAVRSTRGTAFWKNVRYCNMFSRRVRTTSDIKKG